MGFDGVEIACWGDHMDVRAAATDPPVRRGPQGDSEPNKLECWALSGHLAGQCVGDPWDPRLDGFAPPAVKGKPEAIVAWATEEMKLTARRREEHGLQGGDLLHGLAHLALLVLLSPDHGGDDRRTPTRR